ncbi:unnamed protein product [Acanthoscelides obtectus]|uniref:Uncharacterized protein n=1 Tax=Acanthoscelides obtectus TaxID=200917 RepID=A0A9P0KL26_ACAOB|nr:unnamed protein product [Acanthoscelides obtectus]CAK1641782.1 Protein NEDD1 [Acanthoscelides obtectus]
MTLATCSKDLKFYKWPSITYICGYEAAPAECMSIKTISWSCEGNEILAIKNKGTAVVMNSPVGGDDYIEAFDLDVCHVTTGAFSSTNSNNIAFGCENGTMFTYDLNSKNLILRSSLPSGIQHLDFSNDDRTIAVGCTNSQIVLCDHTLKPCASFLIPNSPTLACMTYSKLAPHLLAAGSREGILAMWDTETTDNLLTQRLHTGKVADIAFNNNLVCTVGADGRFSSFDLRSYTKTATLDYDCSFCSLAFLPGCYEMACSTTSGQLRSYDIRNMRSPLRTFLANANVPIRKIAFPQTRFEECSCCSPITSTYTNKSYDEDLSASGDFSIVTDSSLKPSRSADLKTSYPAITPFQPTASEASGTS